MGLPSFEKRDPPPPLPHSKFRLLMSTLGHQDKLPCVAAQALTCGLGRFLWSRNRSPRFLVGRNPWRDYHPHSRHHRPSADAFACIVDGEFAPNVLLCFENPCSNKYEQTSSFPNGV